MRNGWERVDRRRTEAAPRARPLLRSAGFTLIEVLIALLILSFGLLGMALLQTTSLRLNTESYSRSQATFLAYDIIDRIRANPTGWNAGDYDAATHAAAATKIDTYDGCRTSTCNCDGAACSTADLALYDLGQWYTLQNNLLRGVAEDNRSIITRAGNVATVTMRWKERDLLQEQTWEVEL